MKTLLQTAALLAAFSLAFADDKPAGGKTDRKVVTDEDHDADGDGKAEAHAEAKEEVKAGDGEGLPPGVDAEAMMNECKARLREAMKGMKGGMSEECQKLIDSAMEEAAKDGHAVREVKEPGKTIKVEVKMSSSSSSSGQPHAPKQPEPKEKN